MVPSQNATNLADTHFTPAMISPHDPSLFSLINSFFEPNFLILVSYLAINLHLALRVIKLATRRYRQLKTSPPESGELGLVHVPEHAEDDVLQAHNDLFRVGRQHKDPKSDTPVADFLIGLATWSFKSGAVNAKRIFALLAIVSLGSTWYYMVAFLRHSYLSYLERCHLTSYLLPPTPPPFNLARPDLIIPALHLRILRISQWLASLSLFKEAWMEVIKDATSWWWSSEICIITVGAWALFLRHEAERIRVPHIWTVMALGQLVAISLALNLFNLAVIYRLDVRDLLSARADKVFKAKHRAIEPLDVADESSPPFLSEPDYEGLADARPYRVALAMPQRANLSPLASPSTSLPPTPRRSPDPNVRAYSTTVITQRKPLPPQPTLMDKLGQAMQRCIPERVGLPLFVLAGLSSVIQHPDSFTKVMVMHLFPLLISLYPAYHNTDRSVGKRTSAASPPDESIGREPSALPTPTPRLSNRQVILRMFARSDKHLAIWKDAKMYYLGLGIMSILLRAWLTLTCYLEVDNNATFLHRAWLTIASLFPATFFRHPAQSSISSDHVCVALSVTAFVLVEGGSWLWKAAVASPSAYLPGKDEFDAEQSNGQVMSMGLPTPVRMNDADRNLIETQARVLVGLIALSPLLGGSATLSLYLAVRCSWVKQYEAYRALQDDALLHPPERPGAAVLEDTVEVELKENEEGERYLEVRKIKIRELPSGVRGGPQAANQPMATAAETRASPPPSPMSPSVQSQEAQSTRQPAGRSRRHTRAGTAESEAGVATSIDDHPRRMTPIRNRQPPQRYRGDSHTPTPSTPRRHR